MDVMSFGIKGPPNSPPIDFTRLTSNTRITKQASVQNRVTEKARLRHTKVDYLLVFAVERAALRKYIQVFLR